MEPKDSLLHSQVPATCPYPEPPRSSPYPTSHFLKIHLNIIFPSVHGSPLWSLSRRFPHQNPVHASPLPHACHMPLPYHSSWFYHSHNIRWTVQIIKFLVMWCPPHPYYLIPLRPKYSPQQPVYHLISSHPGLPEPS